jgi:hypothetical protein
MPLSPSKHLAPSRLQAEFLFNQNSVGDKTTTSITTNPCPYHHNNEWETLPIRLSRTKELSITFNLI